MNDQPSKNGQPATDVKIRIAAKISDIKIDPEFDLLLPALTSDEHAGLVTSVREVGFTDPLIVWRRHNIIVDGHNRYRIWKNELKSDEHFAPQIVEMPFASRDEVKEFIVRRQLARRNLTDAARVQIALTLKPFLAAKAKENQSGGNLLMNSSKPVNTRKEIADLAGVSEQTVARVEEVLESAPTETKVAMLSGDISVNAAHKALNATSHNQLIKSSREDPSTEFLGKPSNGHSPNKSESDASMSGCATDAKPIDANAAFDRLDKKISTVPKSINILEEHLRQLVVAIDGCNRPSKFPDHRDFLELFRKMARQLDEVKKTMAEMSEKWSKVLRDRRR